MPDPSLFKSKYGSCLIIGKSGSGKTTLLLTILKQLFKQNKQAQLFTLNVKSSEYVKHFPSLTTVLYENLNQLPKRAIIIIEDLIDLNKRHSVLLKETLNYASHHKSQKIFVVTHHVYKNNVFNLLTYFNYIIFTSAQSNLPILENVLKSFKVDKDLLPLWLTAFTEGCNESPFQYFFFDSLTQSFHKALSSKALLLGHFISLDPNVDSHSSSTVATLQHRFNLFSLNHPLKDIGQSVFSILCHSLDTNLVNPNDLTLKAYSKCHKKIIFCSLVDYVFALIAPSDFVSDQTRFLHCYFKNKCIIPSIFIKNTLLT